MAVVSGTIAAYAALASVAISTVSYVEGQDAREEAKNNQQQSLAMQRSAEGENRKIQGEQRAANAASAASERRSQIREERVRRGRIMQSSENTGADGSSGEFGALGSLSTTLNNNIGYNLGRVAAGERTSGYAQNSADFMGRARDFSVAAQNNMVDAQQSDQLFGIGLKIFDASGGFKSPTPKIGKKVVDYPGAEY